MFYRLGAAALFLAVLVVSPLCGDESALAPREGVLLLRNGHVMQGSITKAGDYFVIMLGKTGEVRLPASEIETQCVDLDDAYRYQAALLPSKKAEPHLKLAEWCLRYGLLQHAEDEVAFAKQVEPENPKIAPLQLRLKTATTAPAVSNIKVDTNPATVGAKQLDDTLAELPKGSMERFSVVIQPMLINRCGANGCHGPAAKSDFHLLRPSTGQMMSKRFTQRNLFTVLQYMNKEKPEESRLLTLPQERHGGTAAPVFDKRSQHQLDDLLAWARQLAPKPPQVTLPTTIGQSPTVLTQSGTTGDNSTTKVAADTTGRIPPNIAPMNGGEIDKPRAPRAPSVNDLKNDASKRDGSSPKDPFDPEIFNRKFLPAKS
ncbi:MAG: hypothetical protein K8R36_08665 [Planctomycetales bacterium]|nr:hypothetical protein [Planctomycetales bacterium]